MSGSLQTDLTAAARIEKYGAISDLFFRSLFSLIFIVGGFGHFFQSGHMLARIEESPWHEIIRLFGDPLIHLWLSGVTLVIGGIALALGWKTRLAAFLLLGTIIPITIVIHVAPGHVGPF
jgi:putative oxidoreductase